MVVVARVRSWWPVSHRFCTMPQLLRGTVSGPVEYTLSFLVSELKPRYALMLTQLPSQQCICGFKWLEMVC